MTLSEIEKEFENQFPKNAFWILDCDLANKEKERVVLFIKSQITKALEEVVPEEYKLPDNFEKLSDSSQVLFKVEKRNWDSCCSQILSNIQKFLNN